MESSPEAQSPRFTDRLKQLLARIPRSLLWLLAALGVLGLAGIGLLWFLIGRGLPDAASLANYQPPLPTTLRADDGTPFHSFARERRIYLPYAEIPAVAIQAVTSAEDKTFFEHSGLDYAGIANAVLVNVQSLGSDRRPIGASTITQQVAKNLLLTNEVSIARKLREAILARRIEQLFTKEQILELYLNEVFLGRSAYGIEAASQAYFGKPAAELRAEEAALLAGLLKAPSAYNPATNHSRAMERRNYVLGEMAKNGHLTQAQARTLQATPIDTTNTGVPSLQSDVGGYFIEEVRRQLIERFGEDAQSGPNSVYAGGLWVRTTIDPVVQAAAEKALRNGLLRYDSGRAWRGPVTSIETGEGWAQRLRTANIGVGYPEWRAAVILEKTGGGLTIGLTDGSTAHMSNGDAARPRNGIPAWQQLKPGDVVPVTRISGRSYALRQIPEVSGAMVVQEPQTGRILAMVGGFDVRGSSFNRATQAMRQPGSSFKPFVYAAGLDNGMTPASIVSDAPYCVYQSRALGTKCFRNFGGGYAGAQTMRWGLEQSRNLMTIRIAYNSGMDNVVKLAKDLGIGDYQPVLAIALGAGETTPAKLVNAYSMLINNGKAVEPVLFDLVQDRHGKVIYRADSRPCEGCNATRWQGQQMPRPADNRRQAMDARTAYQVTHMMEGVIQRGTAVTLRSLGVPIAGKTGTTTGPKDVWFVGGTPNFVAGLYIGHDKPRNLGGLQGGTFAAPIWKQFYTEAFKDSPPDPDPFLAPPGVRMVRVDRRSGQRVYGTWPSLDPKAGVIWEAFKADSEPRRIYRSADDLKALQPVQPKARVKSDSDFLRQQGGIY
ncbi:PBP1A family penicillin-binding protein [Sandaracinobacter sp. RS1-74]|uniref:penicillin-binding protein 1A n=1 Tax=Sandaracinobacteroides sayramensis TaxID=2913411 RepID=UPI001EDB8196|nr:PBP1A family penicillin-binding protein [Sandaracinobacteroides sayramensis]MCG2839780.1 PBP1A family penicillin-binding protein [Sandaracinobacteroides sayramensis]